MIDTSKAKIFLAEERGCSETDWFRQYSTFNCSNYQSEHKTPFGVLHGWNELTLGGERSFRLAAQEDSFLFLLPVVGAIEYRDEEGNAFFLQAGQSLLLPLEKGKSIEVCNPYENELVNFLHGWISAADLSCSTPAITSFSLDENKNRLVEITVPQSNLKFLLAKFDGRSEGNFKTTKEGCKVFVFVIQGAFEVQNRLLEAGDGLALWDSEEVEFEALSNEAVLFLLQMAESEEDYP